MTTATANSSSSVAAPALGKGKRERSAKYPGVPLQDSIDLCSFVDSHGLDGLSSTDIATALGYKNIKTNTFSSRLSAARQFGLLALKDDGYSLTQLAKSIIHPVEPSELPKLRRQAFLEPQLYADLAERFANKRVPDPAILGNVLYHDYGIIVTAKQTAAEAFIDSAKYAAALGDDLVLRPNGREPSPAIASTMATPAPASSPSPLSSPSGSAPVQSTVAAALSASPSSSAPSPPLIAASNPAPASASSLKGSDSDSPDADDAVRIDLRLWGKDRGKSIRMHAPESITPESFDRLLQAIRLHVRIEDRDE